MGKRRQSESAELERRRRERDPGGGAVVDMRIDVVFDDDLMISVGGSWDRRGHGFDPVLDGTEIGDPDGARSRVVVEPHEGEIPALKWFMSWMTKHAARRDDPPALDDDAIAKLESGDVDPTEVFSALFAGGRRGGKTWTAALCCALYAVCFPGAIVWVVNPNDQKHDEVRRYFGLLLAHEWIDRETMADGWELVNGSAIMLKSAYVGSDPDAIKEGEAHLVWMNEGQHMAERVYVVGRGAVSDRSGLVLICANPPVQKKDQQWVGDFAADAQARRRMAIYHHFDALKNPHVNRLALLALKRELDERTYRIEVLGEFLPPAEMVAYNWIRTVDGNERPAPAMDDPKWEDVTERYLRQEDIGDGFTHLIGMDFQVHPHMGGPVYKLYMPRGAKRPTRSNVVMWGIGEIVIEGDELEWCSAAFDLGYLPEQTLIIGDGTGEYQHSRRSSVDSPPPTWAGKGSFDIIKMGGYRNIIRPDPRIRRNNPHVRDRVRAMTSMIANANGVRRLFLDSRRCPKTAKSVREWPTVHGQPSRTHEAAHLGDGASYPIVRLFPRILRSENTREVDPIITRIDMPTERPQAFGAPPSEKNRRRDRERRL